VTGAASPHGPPSGPGRSLAEAAHAGGPAGVVRPPVSSGTGGRASPGAAHARRSRVRPDPVPGHRAAARAGRAGARGRRHRRGRARRGRADDEERWRWLGRPERCGS